MNNQDPLLQCGRCHKWKDRKRNFPVDPKKHSGHRGVCFECEEPKKDGHGKFITPKLRQQMCGRKVRYKTWDFAIEAAFKGKSHSIEQIAKLRIYQCPVCDGWHMTKKEKK